MSMKRWIFPKLTLFAELNDVVEAFDVDPDGQRNVLFTNRRQQGTELSYFSLDDLGDFLTNET